MPSGIILSSASHGTDEERQAAVEKVLTDNGYEPDKPEAAAGEQQEAELVEPKREDFKSDEEFEAAQEEFEAKQDEAAEKAEEEAERKRLEALPKKSRRQKAVEKATKELREKTERLERELNELKAGKKPAAAAAEKVEEPKQPKRDDFKTDQEFEDAMFDYRYKLRRAREEAESQQNRLKERLTANFKDYQDSAAAFKEEHDDWEKVVNQSIAIPEAVYYAIVDLGKEGPAVTYHLGKHPELLEDLAQLTPYRAAIEVGRLADKLSGKPAAAAEKPRTQKPKPNMPEPVKPVSTAAATSSTLSSKEAAQKRDYRAFKAAQRRGA